MLIKRKHGKTYVLLQKRKNTGFADGLWDLSCSGHVERSESMTAACVRECAEELGVNIKAEDCAFFAFIHKRDKEHDVTYYNAYFAVDSFEGEPVICEPQKCAEIGWFDITDLPADIIPDRLAAIDAYLIKKPYLEYGW